MKKLNYDLVFLSEFENLTSTELAVNSNRLLSIYKDDLDSNFTMELLQFQKFCTHLLNFDPKNNITREQAMYSLIITKEV